MPKLTKKTIDAAKPKEKDYILWDNDLPGYGLRVFPSGKKSYLVQYRHEGRTRRFTIGLHGPYTPDKARKKAMTLLGAIGEGADPSGDRSKAHKDTTLEKLCELYLTEGCSSKKASTVATDKGRIERHIKPLLGKRLVRSVTQDDVIKFMNDVANGKTKTDDKTKTRGRAIVRGGKGTATRTVGLLGSIFTFAVQKGLRTDNPVHGVKKYPDKRNDRFLSPSEIGKLGAILKRAEDEDINSTAVTALRLLIYTGCRKSEILTLKWDYIDWNARCLRLPDSKTGQKIVPLGTPALEVLKDIEKIEGEDFVLPSSDKGKHYTGLQKVWNTIRAWEGLDDVRIHDLRHSFASVAAQGGDSLLMIGKMLGHKDPKTTQIYAHMADQALHEAAERITETISAVMNKGAEMQQAEGQDDD
ncbi:tyrosine-type recombinase/integrase [Magnetovibrio sp.]|uniref:tyrosine-type recombinase/integrase n=1 Tax=Magnetovibrio sp. TaxID=2024836 RepID=UPI002F921A53